MLPGEAVGRRYRLTRQCGGAPKGSTRWIARDERLAKDVWLDVIDSPAPAAVIKVAAKVRLLRDPRLQRVIEARFDSSREERLAYVVSEIPRGVTFADLLAAGAVTPEVAAAVVAQAADALRGALAHGHHHGALDASSVWVTAKGSVIVAGVAVAGEIAAQSGKGKGRTERADAMALARMLADAVAPGLEGAAGAKALPPELDAGVATACRAVLRSAGPHSLDELLGALGVRGLGPVRELAATHRSWWWEAADGSLMGPTVATPEIAVALESQPEPEPVDEPDTAELPQVLPEAEPQAEPEALPTAQQEALPEAEAVIVAQAPAVDTPAPRATTRFGGAVDDIDEFHDIVAEQNATRRPSILESIFDFLHSRFPQAAVFTRAAEAAHRRASEAPPINAAPLFVGVLMVGLFVTVMVAYEVVTSPFEPENTRPSQEYPEYTFGPGAPSATPTPTPTP